MFWYEHILIITLCTVEVLNEEQQFQKIVKKSKKIFNNSKNSKNY